MKAAVVTSFGQLIEIVDRDVPVPGAGQVLVRLETCGLCHTDIHAARGDWPVQPTLPFVPGHEGVGIVEQLGAGVTHRRVGERVAIVWLGAACGSCRYCVDGRETLCEQQHNSGYSVDGAFAEYAVASATYVVPVPDGISSVDAAPLTCAGLTAYKAMKVARIQPSEQVGVFGVGGLGHLAIQYAEILAGTVVAIDIDDDKLTLAQELGATHTVNAARVEPVAALHDLGGLDVAVVLAPSPHVFDEAYAALRRGGRLICVGMPAHGGAMTVPIFETVVKGLSVIGSIVGTRQDLVEVFALHAAGRTRVISETRDLAQVNEAMAEVLAGTVPARIVFQYAAVPASLPVVLPGAVPVS